MIDLASLTGAPAAGAAGRPPAGAGAAAPDDAASFLDALTAFAALTAAADGAPSDTPDVDDAPGRTGAAIAGAWPDLDADPEAPASADAEAVAAALRGLPFGADPVAPALPPVPAEAAPTAETGGDVVTDSDVAGRGAGDARTSPIAGVGIVPGVPSAPATGTESDVADAPSAATGRRATSPAAAVAAVPDAAPPAASAPAEGPAPSRPPLADAKPLATAVAPDGATNPVPHRSLEHRLAVSSAVLDRLRAQAAGERAESPAVPVAPATPAQTGAIDTAVPPSPSASASSLASSVVAGITTGHQGQPKGSDAGGSDTASGFTFHGQTAPRAATLLPQGPTGAPTFASLVSTMQTPDAVPAETSTQIVQAIRMQMLRDGGEAHIRLDPRQFGDMTVRIKVDQGQVTARVEADTPVVREWLQSNQHVLRQSLAGQQLTLDRLEVHEPPASDSGRREDPSAREQHRQQQQGQRRRRPDTGELFEVVA